MIGSLKSSDDKAEDVDLTLVLVVDKMSELASAATHFPRPASTRIRNLVEGLAAADNRSDFLDKVAMLALMVGPGASSIVNYKCNYQYFDLSRGGIHFGRLRRQIVTVGRTVDHNCSETRKMVVQVVERTRSEGHRMTEKAQQGN